MKHSMMILSAYFTYQVLLSRGSRGSDAQNLDMQSKPFLQKPHLFLLPISLELFAFVQSMTMDTAKTFPFFGILQD